MRWLFGVMNGVLLGWVLVWLFSIGLSGCLDYGLVSWLVKVRCSLCWFCVVGLMMV